MHYRWIKLDTGAVAEFASRNVFRQRGPKWPRVCQGGVGIGESQYPCGERDLFASQRIGITRAVPPLLMPAHEQLRSAISADSRCFAFADNRVTRQVEPLFI